MSQARRIIEGTARAIGIDRAGEAMRDVLAQEVLATAAIEGDKLDPASVRSSVLRHLGLADTGPHDRHVDGLVQVISDASSAFQHPLDHGPGQGRALLHPRTGLDARPLRPGR